MASSSVNALSAGVQQLYNTGLLPTGLSASTLNNSSASQISQLATGAVAAQQTATLLGYGTPTDSATLSPTASESLLAQTGLAPYTNDSNSDPLTAAVNNALTSNINSAVSKFLPQSSTSTGSINLLG